MMVMVTVCARAPDQSFYRWGPAIRKKSLAFSCFVIFRACFAQKRSTPS